MSNLLEGIDFGVKLKDCYVRLDGKLVKVKGNYVPVRTDTNEDFGAVVGSKYKVQDHRKTLVLAEKIVQNVAGEDYTVTHKVEGARIYTRFLLNNQILLPNVKNEASKMSINVINSYDGSFAFTLNLMMWRLVCSNGMYGFGNAYAFKKMHSKGLVLNTQTFKTANETIKLCAKEYEDFYTVLSGEKPTSEDKMEKLFSKRIRDKVEIAYNNNRDKSAWGQYNAYTYTLTHDKFTEQTRLEYHKKLYTFFANTYIGV